MLPSKHVSVDRPLVLVTLSAGVQVSQQHAFHEEMLIHCCKSLQPQHELAAHLATRTQMAPSIRGPELHVLQMTVQPLMHNKLVQEHQQDVPKTGLTTPFGLHRFPCTACSGDRCGVAHAPHLPRAPTGCAKDRCHHSFWSPPISVNVGCWMPVSHVFDPSLGPRAPAMAIGMEACACQCSWICYLAP